MGEGSRWPPNINVNKLKRCEKLYFQVWAILKDEGTGPTDQMVFLQDFYVFTFFILMILAAYYQSQSLAILAGKKLVNFINCFLTLLAVKYLFSFHWMFSCSNH